MGKLFSLSGLEGFKILAFLINGFGSQEPATEAGCTGDIHWNLMKFVATQDGQVTAPFASTTSPLLKAIRDEIKKLLE